MGIAGIFEKNTGPKLLFNKKNTMITKKIKLKKCSGTFLKDLNIVEAIY